MPASHIFLKPSNLFNMCEQLKFRQQLRGKKVRLICNDPDATESSSDDEETFSAKKIIREIHVPSDFYFPSDSEDVNDKVSCLSIFTGNLLSGDISSPSGVGDPLLDSSTKRCLFKPESETVLRKKKSFHKGYINSVSHLLGRTNISRKTKAHSKHNKYKRSRKRPKGKWTAEIRDHVRGVPFRLGGYNFAEKQAEVYDEAGLQSSHPILNPSFYCSIPVLEELSILSQIGSSSVPSQSYVRDSSHEGTSLDHDSFMELDYQETSTSDFGLVHGASATASDTGCTLYVKSDAEFGSSQPPLSLGVTDQCLSVNSPSSILETPMGDPWDFPLLVTPGRNSTDLFKSVEGLGLVPFEANSTKRTANASCDLGSFPVCNETTIPLDDGVLSACDGFSSLATDLGQIFDKKDLHVEFGKHAGVLDFLELHQKSIGFVDMSFDLDLEALAWITTPEIEVYGA